MTIYKITNLINNKIYIGQTIRNVRCRWNSHKSCGVSAIGMAIKKYGKENFSFEVIDQAQSLTELNNKEIEYIKKFNCVAPNGYNLELGGINHEISDESRQKMSKAKIGKTTSLKQKKIVSNLITKYNLSLKGKTKITDVNIEKASKARSKGNYITPMGIFYSSYDAAEANNCSQPTVFNKCKQNKNGWNFIPRIEENNYGKGKSFYRCES